MGRSVLGLDQIERTRIGATMKSFREKAGMTASDLAKSLQISRSHVSNLEAGRKGLTKVMLAKISVALDVPQYAIWSQSAELRLGATLKVLRIKSGYAEHTMAHFLGLNVGAICDMEAGLRPVPPEILSKIAAILDVPIQALITEKIIT